MTPDEKVFWRGVADSFNRMRDEITVECAKIKSNQTNRAYAQQVALIFSGLSVAILEGLKAVETTTRRTEQ